MPTLQTQNLWFRRAPRLLAATAFAAAVGCHLFAHRPAARRLAEVRERTAAARVELANNRAALASLPRVGREVDELRLKLESARALPRHQDLGQFIRDVTEFGQEAALSNLSVQPGLPRSRELVSEIPVSLSFQGDFFGVSSFLRRAESMPRLTAMQGLSIKSVDPLSGTVEVQLSMALYFTDGY